MGKAKQRVFIEFDQEWLSEVVGRGVQNAIDGYNQSLQDMVESEVRDVLQRHVASALRAAAKKALNDQLSGSKVR